MKLAFILILVIGCSCNDKFKVSGIVVDKTSKELLDSVAVTNSDEAAVFGHDWVSTYTDANGEFMVFCSSDEIKKKMRLPFIFQKEGYGSVVEFYPRDQNSDTIYLEKIMFR